MSNDVEDDLAPLDGTEQPPLPEVEEGSMADFEPPMVPGPVTPVAVAEPSPATLLSQALDRGLDPDTLQKFMDLQDRHEANQARRAYADAMAACQEEMQPIVARAENDHTKSYYAKLGVINQQITPIYAKHGFSISFGQGTAAKEGEIRTTARCLHRLGHFEDFHVDFPPDDVGSAGTTNKTQIHARQSSNTYGKRSIVMGIFNLSILTEDDDGNAAGGVGQGRVDEEQAMKLGAAVTDWEINADAIMREFGVQDWAQLPAKKYEKALARINQIGEARKKR